MTARALTASKSLTVHAILSHSNASLQVIVPKQVAESVGGLGKITPTGTSLLVKGILDETPEGKKQVSEPSFLLHSVV